jgi:hypothetical protein
MRRSGSDPMMRFRSSPTCDDAASLVAGCVFGRHPPACSRLHVVCVHGCAMMSQRPPALKKARAAHWNESMPTCPHVFSPSIACASNDVCVVVCVCAAAQFQSMRAHACTCVHMRAHVCTCVHMHTLTSRKDWGGTGTSALHHPRTTHPPTPAHESGIGQPVVGPPARTHTRT